MSRIYSHSCTSHLWWRYLWTQKKTKGLSREDPGALTDPVNSKPIEWMQTVETETHIHFHRVVLGKLPLCILIYNVRGEE